MSNHDDILNSALEDEHHQYPATFKLAVERVLRIEGYQSNHPDDRGQFTRWGISSRANPDLDVHNITIHDAIHAHYTRYWQPSNIPQFCPNRVAYYLLSASVLFGVHQGTKLRQQACNILFSNPRLVVDGKPGSKTWRNTMECINTNAAAFSLALLLEYSQFAALLVRQSPDMSVFIRGWLHRFYPDPFTPKELQELNEC